MVDIFNKMGEELSNMGSEIVKMTKDASDSAKQHGIILSENGKIDNQYHMLGELLYRSCKEDEEILELLGSEFSSCVEKIEKSKKRMEAAKEAIAQNKGGTICSDCGNTVSQGSSFCNKCGKMM
ncbi:MAG: hypothetical protein RR056_07480 [Acetivibrio sp.]